MYSNGMAYLLWAAGCVGFCGVHRFYLGRPVSGIIWFLTAGLLGIGQIVDLFLIPGMVAELNARQNVNVIHVHMDGDRR
jgi:TM2 domain-containing membrane protein YozV